MNSEEVYDITIQVTAGVHAGEVYGFMLSQTQQGIKEWSCLRLLTSPPDMSKHKIAFVVAARNGMMTLAGVPDERTPTQIMSEIENITRSTNGYDNAAILTESNGERYHIIVDSSSPTTQAVRHEGEDELEYRIELNVWSIYTAEDN